ncbi:PD40 domain-containing protein [candidate division KSB1 bacterium]|nr:PD40 domain-containing protein [candidate division KSB1 bacterium]
MIKKLIVFSLAYLLIQTFISPHVFAQQFGRNKIQYEHQQWEFIQSEHFDIYYYQGGQKLATFGAAVAESSYVTLSHLFNYELIERIPIVIYRSHNDFTETNISSQIVGESVGGFTEFFKNRVVLPFDGSYEQFRHVIHHELTHAVMLQFLYGAGAGSIIQGVSRGAPPLWFIEGLAEYTSIGWDTDSDMFVRDATRNGYLPPIPYLQAFLAYKGGQAVLKYIEETYGRQKITELLQRTKSTRNFEKAWRAALNEPLEDSSDKWLSYMRKKYWPDVALRKEPNEYGQRLTDHVKWGNFINNSPAVSPKGDRVAFLTDRTGYFDIYMVQATDKTNITRLASGQKKADLEELQWLRPGMSWSPDGNYLAFTARAAGEDALQIMHVDKKEIVAIHKFGLDGLFAPAWSPVSDEIAFVGVKDGHSDIYIYDRQTDQLRHVTNDIFTDLEPAWSPDGNDIAFVSDRKENVEPTELIGDIRIEDYDYHSTDIYIIHKDGSGMRRITDSPFNQTSPVWHPDGTYLLYVSDQSGVANIYYRDIQSGKETTLTNLISGSAQISWGIRSKRLAFTAFANGGYNIYLWADPFGVAKDTLPPPLTIYAQTFSKQEDRTNTTTFSREERDLITRTVQQTTDFSRFVFGRDFRRGIIDAQYQAIQPVRLQQSTIRDSSGEFKTNNYRIKFSIDNIGANAGYDPIYGFQGLTQMSLSDLLGNHQIVIGANLMQSLMNSDFYLSYQYLKPRTDWSVAGYQFVDLYATNFGSARFANRGISLQASYPISRFRRIDMDIQYVNISQKLLSYSFLPEISYNIIMPTLGYTSDNSIWAYYGPGSGARNHIGISASPKLGNDGKEFITGNFDFRHYYTIRKDYSLALRFAGGVSAGKNPTLFIMGGTENWINYKFERDINVFTLPDYFLSNWMTPLRGANYYELVGTRAALLNIEFRYPFIQYLIARFPIPVGFQNIRGVSFIDAGSAWTNDNAWRFSAKTSNGERYVKDIATGFGYGIRANVYIFLLKFDAAWRTDFNQTSKPIYYFSLGLDF